jgi:ribose 5-phosphate isomerase B
MRDYTVDLSGGSMILSIKAGKNARSYFATHVRGTPLFAPARNLPAASGSVRWRTVRIWTGEHVWFSLEIAGRMRISPPRGIMRQFVNPADGELPVMRIALAADHAGFSLKQPLAEALRNAGHEIVDFGAKDFDAGDDYPDYVLPLARAVASGEVARGIALCGSGVGATVAANKVRGARAALVMDTFSARQGVEDDDMNILCLGARVIGPALARELVDAFLAARYSGAERHARRLAKVIAAEQSSR